VTPMICAYFVREGPSPDRTMLDRFMQRILSWLIAFYARTLTVVLRFRLATLAVMIATIALTGFLFVKVPRGYFPQDDTGLVFGSTEASTDISFPAMRALQQRAVEIVLADPAVEAVGSSVGVSNFNPSANQGRMFINLKSLADRGGMTTAQVVNRLRFRLSKLPGLNVYMVAAADIRVGGRSGKSQYQFTLWGSDIDELQQWLPRVLERVRAIAGLVDVTTDREQGGLQADVVIDRVAAARLGVDISAIDSALNNAFAQRQISTIYTQRNQYRVILEIDPAFQRDPADLSHVYVNGAGNAQIPLSGVARFEKSLAPLVINHQGQFPAITITYNLTPDASIEQASNDIQQAVAELHLPDSIRADFAGDVRAFTQSAGAQPLLIFAALIAVYIVLGVLYESLAHPLTIISTLPSAGLGALLALLVSNSELTVIAFIGIILLIGIVKKNGIMLVDFALEGERQRGLSPDKAIFEACMERFRPILMTTMASLLGAVPFVIATGPGSELRRPLGITIIGGLLISQVLTLYTTPVIYLMLDKLHRRLGGARQAREQAEGRRGPRAPLMPKPARR